MIRPQKPPETGQAAWHSVRSLGGSFDRFEQRLHPFPLNPQCAFDIFLQQTAGADVALALVPQPLKIDLRTSVTFLE